MAYAPLLPELIGGSADLAGRCGKAAARSVSALTRKEWGDATDGSANYIHFGVREFGMAAINERSVRCMAASCRIDATFLTFSDYARNALRMAALMKLRTLWVFTHDSIGLGEDGPTHQSVEHAATLRLIPQMDVWRPCDAIESAVAWIAAIERRDGPTSLLFTRQNVPFQQRTPEQHSAIARGRLRPRRKQPVLRAL